MMPLVGLPAGDGSARAGHRRRGAARAHHARGLRAALRRPPAPTTSTACRPVRAASSPARSGWPTTSCWRAGADEAEALFERLLGLTNDVGLLARSTTRSAERLLGNFPQAFSHVSLVNTAHNLTLGGPQPAHRGDAVASAPVSWPARPVIHEVNTWTWLREIAERAGRTVTLADVPSGRVGRGVPARHRRRVADGRVGAQPGQPRRSPWPTPATSRRSRRRCPTSTSTPTWWARPTACGASWSTSTSAGPRAWPRRARELRDRGRATCCSTSCPTTSHPTTRGPRSIPSTSSPGDDGARYACGRDPYFPPWADTLQLNAFSMPLRRAAAATVLEIADAVRRRALRHGHAAAQPRVRPDLG